MDHETGPPGKAVNLPLWGGIAPLFLVGSLARGAVIPPRELGHEIFHEAFRCFLFALVGEQLGEAGGIDGILLRGPVRGLGGLLGSGFRLARGGGRKEAGPPGLA